MEFIKEFDVFSIKGKNILVNYLTGACDVIDEELKDNILSRRIDAISYENIKNLLARKYMFCNSAEYQAFLREINTKIDQDDKKIHPNFLLIPSYACNLRCAYCYEQEYDFSSTHSNDEWISTAFEFIYHVVDNFRNEVAEDCYRTEQVVITLMGGEPLLESNKKVIEEIANRVRNSNFSYNIITNGVNISEYMDIFNRIKPMSVQVTLDGIAPIHDSRRKTHKGDGTFLTIIKNVHALLDIGVPVYIRMNVDNENLSCVREFAEYIRTEFQGDKHCIPYLYPMQDGGCAYESTVLDETTVIETLQSLELDGYSLDDFLCIFHGSAFVESIRSNTLPQLKMRNCAANKGQYILDSSGYVYKCWFGVGNKNFSIGKYSDLSTVRNTEDLLWMNRTFEKVEGCVDCKYRYICGCGCLSHVLKSSKDILKPKCTDFHRLIELQLSHALRNIV